MLRKNTKILIIDPREAGFFGHNFGRETSPYKYPNTPSEMYLGSSHPKGSNTIANHACQTAEAQI
jgi:hypothetical protein